MSRIVKIFQTNGTVYNLNKGRSGRRRDVKTQECTNVIRSSAIKVQRVFSLAISIVGHESNEHCPYFETGFETLSVADSHEILTNSKW